MGAAALVLLLGPWSCLIDIDRSIACGDGVVIDGEECDPGLPESFRFACGGRPGSCTPDTCQLECCGDNIVNGEEECDGIVIGLVGPDGSPAEGDTCQYVNVPGTDVPYTRGDVRCSNECTIDRSECSLCGNGQVDGAVVYTDGTVLAAEVCDGAVYDLEALAVTCGPTCDVPASAGIACNADCQGCRVLTIAEPAGCCFPSGATPVDERYPCCCTLDPRGCELDITPGDVESQCTGVRQEAGA